MKHFFRKSAQKQLRHSAQKQQSPKSQCQLIAIIIRFCALFLKKCSAKNQYVYGVWVGGHV